jgi:hypothetical protein
MMNTKRTVMTGLVAGALLVGGGSYLAAAQAAPWDGAGAMFGSSVVAADTDLAEALRFAREEERMARDLYQALADKYDDALPFSMIVRSEQRHFDMVGALLDRYDVADPAAEKLAGSYADPTLQKLYDGWLADGSKSLDAAYDVGIALEKRDIADLEDTLESVTQADVRQVLTALLNASRHHLAAFEAAADGETLGQRDGTGWRGQGMGPGNGMGSGYGMGNGGGMMRGGPGGSGLGDCPMLDTTDS